MKRIAVINQKGGSAKTTTSVNLAVGLANHGFRVLLIDADSQGNTTEYFSSDVNSLNFDNFITKEYSGEDPLVWINDALGDPVFPKDINDLLLGQCDIQECIYDTRYEGLKLIPSTNTGLIKTDHIIASNVAHYQLLKKALRSVRHDFDYVIIDNSPTYNAITNNTFFAADEIIIPARIGRDEIIGFIKTMGEIEDFIDNFSKSYRIHLFFNMIPRGNRPKYDAFIKKIHEIYDKNERYTKVNIIDTTIGYQEAVASKSAFKNIPIIETSSNIGKDYQQFVEEMIQLLSGKEES